MSSSTTSAPIDIRFNNDTYYCGLLGRVDDRQDEGTNGASLVRGSATAGSTWTPLTDLAGCHPSGACGDYLRMTVQAVPERSSLSLRAIIGC